MCSRSARAKRFSEIFADAAVFHIGAEQLGQHYADLTLALATPAPDNHHPLALITGDEAVANKLLQGGDVLREKQVRQETQPVDGLGRFGVIPNRKPVSDHFGFVFLKVTIQVQCPIGQMDAVGNWPEVIHLGR